MNPKEIEATVRQLFKMAEHPGTTEHEAALALEKAQAILFKYNLDMASVTTEATPEITGIGKVELVEHKGFTWKRSVLNTIARANLCSVVGQPGYNKAHLFGKRANVQVVLQMYYWITEQLEQMSERSLRAYKREGGREHGRSYKASWHMGANETIRDRLAKPLEEFSNGTGYALVLANKTQLESAVHRVFPRLKTTHRRVSMGAGYGNGRQDGHSVNFSRPSALSNGAKMLGAG